MHGFSKKNVPEFIIGKELAQVCLGENEVILKLSNNCSISIESIEDFAKDNSQFLLGISTFQQNIFGSKIEFIKILDESCAEIHFCSGFRIFLKNDSERYESIVFRQGVDTIVI